MQAAERDIQNAGKANLNVERFVSLQMYSVLYAYVPDVRLI